MTQTSPRPIWGLAIISLLLGPALVMLWLGRGRLAFAYFAVFLILLVSFFALIGYGVVPPAIFAGSDPLYLIAIPSWVFAIVGFVHALKIRILSNNRPWYSRWYVALLLPVIVPLALALAIRIFLLQPFNIPAESSIPNLMVGDYVFVSKTAYGYSRYSFPFNLASFDGRTGSSHPQRGDLAVFKLPANTDIDYVMRVIGLPGDRIQMIGGVLNINSVAVKLDAIELAPQFYAEQEIHYFRETLPGGRSYVIANMDDNGSADNTQEYVVPPGHYFALGDNRDNSLDSRYLDAVGYIPEENFLGPVVYRFWNSRGFSLGDRPEEIHPPTEQ